MSPLNLLVITGYFLVLAAVVWKVSRKAGASGHARKGGSATDFLSARHDLPWWALSLSLVATETSTLTFISIPGVACRQGMVFLGLAAGYCVGRGIVAIWLLPRYAGGTLTSVYALLGARYGASMQRIASAAFLLTRFLAESVRLLAGTLPVMWLLAQSGLPLARWTILSGILLFTLGYTVLGGLKAVIWTDSIQLGLYGAGAAFCVLYLMPALPADAWSHARAAGLTRLFHPLSPGHLLSDPFTLPAALIGGAILSIASHGTDQLMVQRLLAARSLREARLALIGSAILVAALFGLLSLLGIEIRLARNGGDPGISLSGSPDMLFPHFIATALPSGISGLLVAGVLSATMGSLSSTLNAMAGASLTDFGPFLRLRIERALCWLGYRPGPLTVARLLTLFWGVALVTGAALFTMGSHSAVIVGLSIAGWSYGPTLGAFLLALFVPGIGMCEARFGFLASLAGMALLLFSGQALGWEIAFSWLVPLGLLLHCVATGLYRAAHRHRSP